MTPPSAMFNPLSGHQRVHPPTSPHNRCFLSGEVAEITPAEMLASLLHLPPIKVVTNCQCSKMMSRLKFANLHYLNVHV